MQEPNGNYSISFEELSRRQKEILDKQEPVTYEQAKAQVERLKKGSYLRRMELELIKKKLEELWYEWRDESPRRIRIQTGPGGMDLFNEVMENDGGFERVYTDKVPRFTKIFNWRTSCTGRKYRLLKMSL